MTNFRRVRYTFEGATFLTMFPVQRTIGEFLDVVKERLQGFDLDSVFFDGVRLPLGELFDDWYEQGMAWEIGRSSAPPADIALDLENRPLFPPSVVPPPDDPPSATIASRKHYVIHMNTRDRTVRLSWRCEE
jgi:hypothetical protein